MTIRVNSTKKWGAIVHEGIEQLLSCDLTATDYEILLHLFLIMNESNNIALTSQKMLGNLKNSYQEGSKIKNKSTISRSINKMIDCNILKRMDGGFMINPNIYYFGKTWKNLPKMRQKFNE